MLKKISEKTVELIKEKMNENSLPPPLTKEKLEVIFEWLDNEEVTLANGKADGEVIDEAYFDAICNAVNEFLKIDDIDIDDLNKRLLNA